MAGHHPTPATCHLSQPVQAQLLRFEFPSEEIVELYEIEMY